MNYWLLKSEPVKYAWGQIVERQKDLLGWGKELPG